MSKRLIVVVVMVGLGCGSPAAPEDAGFDAGVTADSGTSDAGLPDASMSADAGPIDSGTQDSGTFDAGQIDAGQIDAGQIDAGVKDAGFDAGTVDAGKIDAGFATDGGPIMAIRFGASQGSDGVYTRAIANPNLRTVAGWFRLRIAVPGVMGSPAPRASNGTSQECIWGFEDDPPSQAYQLMVNTYMLNQWESHDRAQGGFLFAPVDLGWWFIAETNNGSAPATALFWKKEGAANLSTSSGNNHPMFPNATRFLIGTDDATGQNEWFDGDIAGVKVWDAQLTPAELALEANHFNPVRLTNLHAFYPLQSVPTMFNDTSGFGRTLTPIGDGGSWSVQPGPSVPY
jgi:hypothetical protein